MPKTLADVAPQELADYKGMWVDVPHKPHPVIYMGDFESTGEIKHGARIFDPRYGDNYCRLDDCTLRPDLPRAWPPDGTPVAGDWEYAVQYKTPDGWAYSRESWDCRWQESEAAQEVRALRDHPGEETRIVRRLVSQPEVMEP